MQSTRLVRIVILPNLTQRLGLDGVGVFAPLYATIRTLAMTDTAIHPMAPHHLPPFIPGPDGSDWMFTVVVVSLVVMLLIVGNLYLKLHAWPERMAHGKNHFQTQAITILALLALFTHNNVFWVAALLLAVIRFPDFQTPLESIAGSLRRLTRREARAEPASIEPEVLPAGHSEPPQKAEG